MSACTRSARWPRLMAVVFVTYSLAAASMFVGALAFYASYALGPGHFALSYVAPIIAGAAMYAPYGPFFAIIPELLPRNVAGAATGLLTLAVRVSPRAPAMAAAS
jgi:hypothetical protein